MGMASLYSPCWASTCGSKWGVITWTQAGPRSPSRGQPCQAPSHLTSSKSISSNCPRAPVTPTLLPGALNYLSGPPGSVPLPMNVGFTVGKWPRHCSLLLLHHHLGWLEKPTGCCQSFGHIEWFRARRVTQASQWDPARTMLGALGGQLLSGKDALLGRNKTMWETFMIQKFLYSTDPFIFYDEKVNVILWE